MLATSILALGLLSGSAQAVPEMVRYDSYADDGDHIWGGYFPDPDAGFGKNNCMAMVYSFTEDQYPLIPTGMRIFWAGEGAGVTQEAMMRLYVEWYEGEADEFVMAAGSFTERLEQERFLVAGIDLEGTWQELDFATEGIEIDFEPDVPGVQPITFGSLVMSICYVNEQMFPEIAMDSNGFEPEPLPESGDVHLEGHETSRFRSLIYWNGVWQTSDQYLRENFGFDGAGDFIMRLLIDAQVDETGASASCPLSEEWNPDTISPAKAYAGDRQNVIITGSYSFPEDATVSLDDYALLDINVNSSCGIEGVVDPSTPAGTYDVIVTASGTVRTLERAFTVEKKSKGGCVTVATRAKGLAWLLPLLGLGLLVRRRRD